MQDLGTLSGTGSQAYGINEAGQVVGVANTLGNGRPHAFLYSNGTMQDLGTLGGTASNAYDINEAGQVVGFAHLSGDAESHAFLYSNGTMLDLNALLPAGSGWVLTEARAINNTGEIVGFGLHNGLSRGFLLKINEDLDNDGIVDERDNCPGTPAGQVVNTSGCSIDQLCPCEQQWKNHGQYVSCVENVAEDFAAAGLITEEEQSAIVSEARQSSCGKKQ